QDSIVAIPMRETPMIKRNRDIRNASRRSSFNLRGKRASSIGNGFAALPHPSIDPKSFFRHIAAEEPPPVRMKQLMAWCARKTIDSQRSNSQSALKIAKLIEEETLAMLIAGKFSVSWYSRPLDMEPIRVVPKKPHQQNVENTRKLRECEAQIAKLRKEDEEWTTVISS
ncbi:kinetochore-associated protein Dsn1/Mis13, partial [Dissophora ornata]